MKRMKAGIYGMMLLVILSLSACGTHTADRAAGTLLTAQDTADRAAGTLLTAQDTAECTMESLKTLDLEELNECTDNYIETYYNWIGVPVETEYRVFNELLQPGAKTGKRKKKYEFNHTIAEKMTKNLAWEIKDVREDGDNAEITMEITNLNMADVMGKYEIYLFENMLDSPGTGLGQMIKDISNIMDDDGGLLAIVEACDKDDICTLEVTVSAYRENGKWKIHLDDEFINAFMGNFNSMAYSEDVQKRLDELEKQQEEKWDEWAEEFADDVERRAERLFGE
ncbi:MAG: hypothetical protein K2N00_09605 [Lachnospiraceae bacterium]|nr:hypothetical protein [Lachnospiraceae bacterium]